MLRLVVDKGIPEDKTYHVTFFPVGTEYDQVTTDFLKRVRGEYAAAATIAECLGCAPLPDGFAYAWHFYHKKYGKIHDFPKGYQVTEALVERLVEQKGSPYTASEKPRGGAKPGSGEEPAAPDGRAKDRPAEHGSRRGVECADIIDEMVAGRPPDEAVCIASVVRGVYCYGEDDPARPLEDAEWYLRRLAAKVEARTGK